MRNSYEILLEKYQVRRTKKQKQEFSSWLTGHLSKYGYDVLKDTYSKNGCNLVVGNVESAEIIFTAHYDTPPNFFIPIVMTFSNWISFILSQILLSLPIICLLWSANWVLHNDLITGWFLLPINILLILYAIQITIGFANKHTANDNTSGVATLISILEEMPEKDKEKICVVFFDQEELGLVGAFKFREKYETFVKEKPLINFDCVSDGETFVFVSKKKFQESKYYETLKMATTVALKDSKKQTRFMKAIWAPYMSDQLVFPHGVGVVAAKKAPLLGYYIDRIHSKWDTKFDEKNIELLTDTAIHLVKQL